MSKVVVKGLDGNLFEAKITSVDDAFSCAVVRRDSTRAVIVRNASGTWREVPLHHRGDIILIDKKEPVQAEVIHVLDATKADPLIYVYIPVGARYPDVATPHEIIEK